MNDASNPSRPPFPQPVSGTVVPRFGDVATFMRMPLFRDPADVEIGMIGDSEGDRFVAAVEEFVTARKALLQPQ